MRHIYVIVTIAIFCTKILGRPINMQINNDEYGEDSFKNDLFDSLKSEILSRQRRQTQNVTSKIVGTLVEGIVNAVKPNIGNQALILEAFKPLFISFGTGLIDESIKIMKNMMNQRPLFDFKLLKEKTYGVYPVFIPGYGSFILVSQMGMVEELKEKMVNSSHKDFDEFDYKTNSNLSSIDTIDNNTNTSMLNDNINLNENLTKELNENVTKIDHLSQPRQFEEEFKPNEFDLGEAHLIPMVNEPNIFENSRSVKESVIDINDNNMIKGYLRYIIKGQKTIKSLKKRIILDLLKKLENAVYNL